jgi:hypothetical protein
MAIVVTTSDTMFATLHSSIYDAWVRYYTSTNLLLVRITIEDCFDKFPFPSGTDHLNTIGRAYHERRREIMLKYGEGLTDTYNRFHDPYEKSEDIIRLRTLHIEMDRAVAAAYSWSDLDLGHGFHETKQGVRYTISEPTRCIVLDRLRTLNHKRHTEEEAEKAAAPVKRRLKRSRPEKLTLDLL